MRLCHSLATGTGTEGHPQPASGPPRASHSRCPCGACWAPGSVSPQCPRAACTAERPQRSSAGTLTRSRRRWLRTWAQREEWEGPRESQAQEKPRGGGSSRQAWANWVGIPAGRGLCGHRGAAAAHSSSRRRRDLGRGRQQIQASQDAPPQAESVLPLHSPDVVAVSAVGSLDRNSPWNLVPEFTTSLL